MKQYIRYYIDDVNNSVHVVTSDAPLTHDHVGVPSSPLRKIDAEYDSIEDRFVRGRELLEDTELDPIKKEPKFKPNKKLKGNLKITKGKP